MSEIRRTGDDACDVCAGDEDGSSALEANPRGYAEACPRQSTTVRDPTMRDAHDVMPLLYELKISWDVVEAPEVARGALEAIRKILAARFSSRRHIISFRLLYIKCVFPILW